MNLNLDCEDVRITPSHKQVYVQLEGVDKSDVMDHFDIVEFLHHFSINDVLDYIGVDDVKKYFNLKESDE
jgi:hypothetical protein